MTQGQCMCGTVQYEVDGPFTMMWNCHCSRCRKHHGAPFATFVSAPLASFRWIGGQHSISAFKTQSGTRSFCQTCGSVTPVLIEDAGVAGIPAGNLDGDLGIEPQAHIFTGSKAPWYEIKDSLPQHETFPPEFGGAVVDMPQVEDKEGVMQGSCLCGEVAYEIEGMPDLFMYCHCSRCRRSRSAAHGANMFVKSAQFRWVRGESLVKHYKDPNAQRFATSFCARCGSGAPRANREIPVVLIPAGTLDTALDIEPTARIFVGSKASWLHLADDVPRFEAMPPRP